MSAAAAHWPLFDAAFPDDPMRLPLDRFCNRVYAWLRERMEPGAFDSWWLRVNIPRDGSEPESGPWSEDAMVSAFLAAEEVLT